MRELVERFIQRHEREGRLLDADVIAEALRRYLPEDTQDERTLRELRRLVIAVASERFVPVRWGRMAMPKPPAAPPARAPSRPGA
ncbi:hypothetical protein [Lutibaculum baratangense]|uniref:Uncharacterized protein n=1 Tax=Lutibaculum baratangense AMV1 TaxID=631454 RepID=V4THM6_9HYPH|nr:hypothetical protein [Lutibaculum baratangense]ESR25533.1 hypothetical protein N177_1645 [Lutibaculum baratangense AMV1]